MKRINNGVLAIGVFFALPIIQGFAADQRTLGRAATLNNQTTSGVFQNGGTTGKPPVLAQPTPFSCDKGTCQCNDQTDCGEMGRLGVCKTGTFKPSKSGSGGSCTMKQV